MWILVFYESGTIIRYSCDMCSVLTKSLSINLDRRLREATEVDVGPSKLQLRTRFIE